MKLTQRPFQSPDDYWRIRAFLRETFLLNDRREHSWPVARWDYWRWHFVENLQLCGPLEQAVTLWETADGRIAAVLHPIVPGEIKLHLHPQWATTDLEAEMLAHAEATLALWDESLGSYRLHLGVDADDVRRQQALIRRGFHQRSGISHKWFRNLDAPVPVATAVPGYTIRAMGTEAEHPARSWASWLAFHGDEPAENYDGDWSWFANIQKMPLYRRDLDMVAATESGEIAAFATLAYDDCTRGAVCVLVGTAVPHQRRGLGRALLLEGFRRVQQLGGLRIFATAYDPAAYGLYGAVMHAHVVAHTWYKEIEGA